ncbi:uncharacterized protein LOC120913323 [Rana temporaria]|uniref:uncharacterized protein LOC120913323 n=1 Tax=Rana temporaria TaxID=8407 RepID=UPI001AACB027|nr:uncharacterized protein LOC120913323 [Rana temporaria]
MAQNGTSLQKDVDTKPEETTENVVEDSKPEETKNGVEDSKPEETAENGVEDSKETNASPQNSSGVRTMAKSSVPAKNQGFIKSLLIRISRIWPLKYVFVMLRKIAAFAGFPEVESIGIADQMQSPRRRFLSGKKRIGRLARLILLLTPYRLQCALGYHAAENIGNAEVSDEIRKSPLKPHGKGSKRKQDDIEVEEEYHSWVTFMAEDLPDEDQEDDPTYEPSKFSNSDSEENRSKNDTESDLEVEEKDGMFMLKESTQDPPANEAQIQNGEIEPINEEQKTSAE